MTKKMLFLLVVAGLALAFTTSSVYAGSEFPEVIKIEADGIIAKKGDKYKAVTFKHKAHSGYGYTCSDCHHDDKGKSIEGLKAGDSVQKCIECHSNLSMGKDDKKKKDSYYYAFHGKGTESCKGCHKAYNTKKGFKKKDKGYAPNGCTDCHKKK